MKDILGVIPARYKSSRFPGKPLKDILGKPMIIHVAEKVEKAIGKDNTIIATDDLRIAKVVKEYGYNCIITSDTHKTGTDRLYEVSQKIDAKMYINIQGDEPIINPADIVKIISGKNKFPDKIINGYSLISNIEDPESYNIPKVIFNEENELIYMSRLAIPAIKSGNIKPVYYKQVCIYAFNKKELKAFGERTKKTTLESFEDIEILRFLEMGYPIKMILTDSISLAVDVPDDILKVENFLKNQK